MDGAADAGVLRGNIGQLRKLKAKHPQLKVLWSFGGWNGSKGFTEAARDPAAFAESCHALLTDPRWSGVFDGIDVDWEYPNACGLACDASGRGALTGDARRPADKSRAVGLVTAAVPGDVSKLDKADYAGGGPAGDWLSAMTYDFFGTGRGSRPDGRPLAADRVRRDPASDRDRRRDDPQAARPGRPRRTKVLLGVGFYGRGWTGVHRRDPGVTWTGPAKGTYEQGLEDYRVLAERCPPTGEIGGTAYAFCGDQWWSYDTPATIRAKMAYVRTHALGGAFAWELSGDTASADLLEAMSSGLA